MSHLNDRKIIDRTWDKPLEVHVFIRQDQKDSFLKKPS
jgi:hypothetical protein